MVFLSIFPLISYKSRKEFWHTRILREHTISVIMMALVLSSMSSVKETLPIFNVANTKQDKDMQTQSTTRQYRKRLYFKSQSTLVTRDEARTGGTKLLKTILKTNIVTYYLYKNLRSNLGGPTASTAAAFLINKLSHEPRTPKYSLLIFF